MVGQVEEGRLVAGRYRLLERIGRGGMGTVWLAEDELLGRRVAVKKLHPPQPHMHDDELATLFERTRREARAAARISHPNVIVVHDVVDDAGLPSIVMEYVPSLTLGERLKREGALPVAEVARIGRGMIAALRAAHGVGVLHRDVKPGNVLLGEEDTTHGGGYGDTYGDSYGGRVVLTDFGIAQASGTSTLTRTGELIGSIDFLSPERIRGAVPGPEADLWALGATLYQAVEGQSPFRRPTAIETAYAIAEEPVVPAANAGALTRVIAGLLAKEPGERLSAEEAERMLRIPAAEQETAFVDRPRFERRRAEPGDTGTDNGGQGQEPPTARVTHQPAAPPPGPRQEPYRHGDAYQPGNPYQQQAYSPQQPYAQPHPYPQDTQAPAARRRGRRAWIAGAAAVVVLAAGAAVAATRFGSHDTGADPGPTMTTSPAPTTTTATPTPATPTPPPVPDGYRLAQQRNRGYAVPVPEGWTKTVKDGGDEVDWVDPTGLVGLKISALSFGSNDPYQHWLTLEPDTRAQVEDYHRERMERTTQHGQPAAIWQFTFRGSVRDFRAVDLGFGRPGGTEYAIYLSAPKAQWDTYRVVFENAVAGFRQTRS